MLEDVKRYVEAVLDKLSPAKAQAMARAMAGGSRERVNELAKDLMEWSQRNRERLTELVRREVRAQLKALGVASKEELESLKRRVRELEKGAGKAPRRTAPRAGTGGGTKATG